MPGSAIVYVTDYGARGDVQSATGSIAAGGTTLTLTGGAFSSADVGKQVLVAGAGPRVTENGETAVVPLFTTIRAVAGPTRATLGARATHGVSGARVRWGTDDTESFRESARRIQASGGGRLRIPPGTFWLFPPSQPLPRGNGGLGDFTGLTGVHIAGEGATLLTARPGTALSSFNLFTFQDCGDVQVSGVSVQGHMLEGLQMVVQNAVLVHLFGACRTVSVTATCTGIYAPLVATAGPRGGPRRANDYAGDESQRSRGIRLAVNATNCGYGALFQFSGDDVDATLVTNACYRSYMAYGARDHRLRIDSSNHLGADVLLQAYKGRAGTGRPTGFGVSNVSIDYVNRATSRPWMVRHGAAAVEIDFAEDAAGAHRDVRVRYDVRYSPDRNARFGPVLRVKNSSPPGITGHRVERLRVEGRVEGPGDPFDFNYADTLVGQGGRVRVGIHDLVLADLTLANTQRPRLDLRALATPAEFRCVVSDAGLPVQTTGAGRVRYVGCRAAFLSYTPDDALPADYLDCVIGSWAEQSTLGKTFRNTTVGGYPLEIEPWEGDAHRHAAVARTGGLAGWFDAFRVRHPGVSASYRLRYHVSAAAGREGAAARREITGTAVWSAFMGAAVGRYDLELPVEHEDRSLASSSPAVEVRLRPGSGYATVQLRVRECGDAAGAAFRLEVLGAGVRDVVPVSG